MIMWWAKGELEFTLLLLQTAISEHRGNKITCRSDKELAKSCNFLMMSLVSSTRFEVPSGINMKYMALKILFLILYYMFKLKLHGILKKTMRALGKYIIYMEPPHSHLQSHKRDTSVLM